MNSKIHQSLVGRTKHFDSSFDPQEQLPRNFNVHFKEIDNKSCQVLFNGSIQSGDIIDDNSYQNDFYRYHDIFHYTFAAMLGWSPCTRAMLKRKRKSNELVDRIEDGARAAITEEAISLILFNEARHNNFFRDTNKIDTSILRIIKNMTSCLEVKERTEEEWEQAILKGYEIFRMLIKNNGGKVDFDLNNKIVNYSALS